MSIVFQIRPVSYYFLVFYNSQSINLNTQLFLYILYKDSEPRTYKTGIVTAASRSSDIKKKKNLNIIMYNYNETRGKSNSVTRTVEINND